MNSPAVLRNRNDLLQNWFRFRVFRLWNSFCSGSGSGSGSRQQFSKNQKKSQNLAFSMSEADYFPESCPSFFDFLLFITFYVDLDPNPVPNWNRIRNRNHNAFRFRLGKKVTGPAVPAPQ
jgi:hypothetical protein